MSKRHVAGALLLACLWAGAMACHKKKEGPPPSPLAGATMSRQSLQEAGKALKIQPNEWETVEDLHPLAGEPQTWRQLRVVRRGYRLYGQTGDLELSFFNDKLVGVRFFVSDYEAARDQAAVEQKLSFADDEAQLPPSTWVYRGRDENGRVYLGWIDKVMQAEQNSAQR